jgi:threonine/homoserine/homoserine lactone efflux protein
VARKRTLAAIETSEGTMLGTHDLPAFLLASFLLWITPGPDTMYILARSLSQGLRAGVMSVLGISTGIMIHTAGAAFGLSALLATSAFAFDVVRYAGACYLIYLGVRALRKRPASLAAPELIRTGAWRIYRQGMLTNVLNPKVAMFFLAFLPQFIDPIAGRGPRPFLFLGGLFVVGGTLWCLGVVAMSVRATRAIRRNASVVAWLERVSGCVYIGLGLNLLRSRPHPA